MSFEYRFDKADLQSPIFVEGFLRAKVRLTKPGVYPYTMADGTVRQEAKPPEEIYSESFLKSLDGLIATDGHPYEFGGLVNSSNYKSLMKGVILNPRIEGEYVVADEVLFDPELIESVKRGEKIEVSLGMKSDPVMESGVLFGERYDSIQNLVRIDKTNKKLEVDYTKLDFTGQKDCFWISPKVAEFHKNSLSLEWKVDPIGLPCPNVSPAPNVAPRGLLVQRGFYNTHDLCC